jgi:lipopolysaccharide transport system ATP-binding protein
MSSDDIAIRVSNLSKCYQIYDSPRDRLKQFVVPRLQRLTGQTPRQYFREFWALKDVSLAIGKGETVGIVGRNGSGKSTLLQILCGTLFPTRGDVQTRGRVAALLELGSAFNPDFTGRENVYFNAALLGLHQKEVDDRFDAIAAFADIGEFIERPVKTYSSGMMLRLAFSVAINADPKILVVDEALAVGDELFQRKCLSRIEAIKNNGATILFVSHSGATVVDLCDRAILLDRGELLASGAPKNIVGKYQTLLYAPAERQEAIRSSIKGSVLAGETVSPYSPTQYADSGSDHGDQQTESEEFFDPGLLPQSTICYESRGATIDTPRIVNLANAPVNSLRRGRTYRYLFRVRFDAEARNVRFGMLIKTLSGVEIGGAVSASMARNAIRTIASGALAEVEFRFECTLNPGTYFLNAGVLGEQSGGETYLHRILDACVFCVLPDRECHSTGFVDFHCVPHVAIRPQETPH